MKKFFKFLFKGLVNNEEVIYESKKQIVPQRHKIILEERRQSAFAFLRICRRTVKKRLDFFVFC